IEGAEDNARKMPPEGRQRLAIVFVMPRFATQLKSNLNKAIRNWLRRLREYPCDALAWNFPPFTRHVIKRRKYYYPGTAVVIRRI
ncbi:MAG: hypothetical protein NTY01_11125, partial [Verrucomicrobia bacterium]|nr:hypothetical protein [Verrucomicrobiota bacterium]